MKRKSISYAKWGYFFIAPFFIAYAIFQLWPLITTIYRSFFENYTTATFQRVNEFVGFENYVSFFTNPLFGRLFFNTIVMWLMGFIPQLIISLLFAYWFTNKRLDLKCTGAFKSIIYMPNLIMAAAFSMLIFSLFANHNNGPVNSMLISMGIVDNYIDFQNVNEWSPRILIAFMNFMMWFGNTTILLMAGMMGVDESLVEAAEIDGCTPGQIFRKITIPLIRPIMVYVMITSMVGGLQMFDVPSIFMNGGRGPNQSVVTLIMYLNENLTTSKNYGMAGAISVVLFILCAALSLVVYYFFTDRTLGGAKSYGKKKKKGA